MGMLDGKVALVSGAAGGIASAIAALFAEQGASVLVHEHPGEPIDDAAAAARLVASAVAAFGRLDALVVEAIPTPLAGLLDADEASWDRDVSAELRRAYLLVQAAARQLRAQGEGGRILLCLRREGLLGARGRWYDAAAHAALAALARAAAVELQRDRIAVTAIAAVTRADEPSGDAADAATFRAELAPERVAQAALYLCSEAGGSRTGTVLAVAGPRLAALRLCETRGYALAGEEPWTAEAIERHWSAIVKA